MATLSEIAALAAAYDMPTMATAEPDPMKTQVMRTAEIRGEHQRLNDRYQMLVDMYGQYVEMFEQWLAERA